ncbi:hypothetical protein JKF63_04477 [Porcisia hertigi]|uniref:Uncharacterized protein n=1 Tax=Porcisia hertigi TaxID=2761500 RepID=A0A836IVK9_9TRYP|nr:hypothetical protein JKF63_04477 [Porcisia hertigi]
MRTRLSMGSYARVFAGRTWKLSERGALSSAFCQRCLPLTSSALRCSMRPASSRASRTAASTSVEKRKQKRSSTRSSRVRGTTAAEAHPPKEHGIADLIAAEEHRLSENDVRLAMRTLMASHFSLVQHARRPEKVQAAKEREAIEMRHQGRQQRLLEKDENSLRLLGADGMTMGDGILPLLSASKGNPYDTINFRSATPSAENGAWRALNPVGLSASQAVASASLPGDGGDNTDALSESDYTSFLGRSGASLMGGSVEAEEGDLDAWKSATLATLSVPDLSVYDTDHDFRINSEEALRQAASNRSKASSSSSGNTSGVQAEGLGDSTGVGPLSTSPGALKATAAAMQVQFEDDEDSDYTISMFTDDKDDPLNL